MNYAIVTLFGFLSGIVATIHFIKSALNHSREARRPLIELIHNVYGDEYAEYCILKCANTDIKDIK